MTAWLGFLVTVHTVPCTLLHGSEPILIVNSRGKNVVMMSEEEYENIQETLFFTENPVMNKILTDGLNTPTEDCVEFDGWT